MAIYMNVYTRVCELAKEKNISIKELAKKAHIGENSIYRWKNMRPSTQSLTKVANILEVSTDYLLGENVDFDRKIDVDISNDSVFLSYRGHRVPDEYLIMIRKLMEYDFTHTED